MALRTDLALERRELIGDRIPDGVIFEEFVDSDIKTTKITVTNENGAEQLGKPVGRYYTVEYESAEGFEGEDDLRLTAFTSALKELLPEDGTVLVAGLGNENITPDALGPRTVDGVFATRHISENAAKFGLPELRNVSAIATGVLGQTGIETGEIIKAVCEKINPSAVIVVDALASLSADRLGKTVQLSDTGICPGSGVGNSRAEISEKTLGVRVVSVGVPTVIDASSLLDGRKGKGEKTDTLMVTPRNIDRIITDMSRLLSAGINLSLQRELKLTVIDSLF